MVTLGRGAGRELAGHWLGGWEVEAVPGVSQARRGWPRERRASRSGGGAGGVTGRPPDPSGGAFSLPAQIPLELGPHPRAPAPSRVSARARAAAEKLAAAASGPAA